MHLRYILFVLFFPFAVAAFAQIAPSTSSSDSTVADFDTNYVFDFFMLEDRAYFTQGDVNDFIDSNIVMPEKIQKCVLMVDFIIEPDSSFSKVIVYSPNERVVMDAAHQKAAKDVIMKMEGQWEPARIGDRKVRMRMSLPVRFRPE